MPRIENSYCAKSSNNTRVDFGNVTVWFSYVTPVAFQVGHNDIVVHENDWGRTTGKHLNAIEPDHSKRVDHDTFCKLWNEQASIAPLSV